ncbi:MAG: hypothetical protein WCI03_00590 [bacterium]|jgi:hypothetical protein
MPAPPDHSFPPEVKFETLEDFFERGRRMTATGLDFPAPFWQRPSHE